MSSFPKRLIQVPHNFWRWWAINLRNLSKWRRFRPPRNGRPTVLLALAQPGHPFYESWREGIEANGWNVCWLPRAFEIRFSHQLLLYLALCPWVQAVHLIDVDLLNLFGEYNALRRTMSFTALHLIAWWPRLLGKRQVYTFGNFVPHEFDTPAERRRHRLICSLAQDVTSGSASMTGALIESGIAASRIWPADHADIAGYFRFPADWLELRQEYGIPSEAILLLCAGTIRPYKGVEVAVQAIKQCSNPDLRLFIAGQPSAGYTRDQVEALAAEDSRIVLGPLRRLTDAEMGWMFAAADYCVLPYRDIGHSGLVCQSLGLGVPVIGSRVGCLPDYLGTGAGILFAPGDVEELAEVLDCLESFDREAARAEGLRIMQQRTPERVGLRLVRLYQYRRGGPKPEADWLF